MNIIARLEYELAYYDSAVHCFNHYTTRTPLYGWAILRWVFGPRRSSRLYLLSRAKFITWQLRHPRKKGMTCRSIIFVTVIHKSWFMHISSTITWLNVKSDLVKSHKSAPLLIGSSDTYISVNKYTHIHTHTQSIVEEQSCYFKGWTSAYLFFRVLV